MELNGFLSEFVSFLLEFYCIGYFVEWLPIGIDWFPIRDDLVPIGVDWIPIGKRVVSQRILNGFR